MGQELFGVFLRFYLILEKGEGKEQERDRNINVCLPLMCPPLGTWPSTRALTGNRTGDSLAHRPVLNPLSHTSQGGTVLLMEKLRFTH